MRFVQKLKASCSNSIIISAFKLLDKRDRKRTLQVLCIQTSLALLDLVGVGIIGALGALTISGASARGPGDRVAWLLAILGLENYRIQTQALLLGALAAGILVGKTFVSMFLLKKTNLYLARRGARLSADLIEKVFLFPFLRLREQSLMNWQYQLTLAIDVISVGIITTAILMISDLILLTVMGIGLFYLEPTIAFGALLLFSSSALVVYKKQHQQSLSVGSQMAILSVRTNETLQLVFDSYRDLFVRAALPNYGKKMRELRMQTADLSALRAYMPYVGKFTLEITMVLGFLFIAGSQFFLNEVSRAVANIAVFFVASARISPAILRIQQGFLMMRTNRGQAESALSLISEVKNRVGLPKAHPKVTAYHHKKESLSVTFSEVTYRYPKNDSFLLNNLDFVISPGDSVAMIGSSGSGKSTIVDLILGLLTPLQGDVVVGNEPPAEVISKSPGSIAFVPQRIVVANRTLKENLALGLEGFEIPESDYWDALETAQLRTFVKDLPQKLDTLLGVGGIELSGGQIQRLGLARALLTKPNLLILDEATSALDGKTEFLVTEALEKLKGSLTLIVIAHRLSTIKDFKRVMYFKEGKLIGQGTFTELVSLIPDLAEQAELMRL